MNHQQYLSRRTSFSSALFALALCSIALPVMAQGALTPAPVLPGVVQMADTPADAKPPIKVALGGPAVAPFVAESSVPNLKIEGSAGTYMADVTIDVSKAKDAAPAEVYKNEQYGPDMKFTFSKLTPNTKYQVRLHMAETYLTAAGERVFDVSINGKDVLTKFDMFKDSGANVAIVKTFDTTSDATGNIVIGAKASVENAALKGIEILPAS